MKTAFKIILGLIVLMAALIIGGCSVLMYSMFVDRSEFMENLVEYDTLPNTASDITVYIARSITGNFLADFTITEEVIRDFPSGAGSHTGKFRQSNAGYYGQLVD